MADFGKDLGIPMFFKRKRKNNSATVDGTREISPLDSSIDSKSVTVHDWLLARIQQEPYWFLKMELPGGLITPGWSDPKLDKLPHYGLPADMTGMRVLDIGHAEGFFSFEAERRGAAEVVGIENYPPMARTLLLGQRLRPQSENFWHFRSGDVLRCSLSLAPPFARAGEDSFGLYRNAADANLHLRRSGRHTHGGVSSLRHQERACGEPQLRSDLLLVPKHCRVRRDAAT